LEFIFKKRKKGKGYVAFFVVVQLERKGDKQGVHPFVRIIGE